MIDDIIIIAIILNYILSEFSAICDFSVEHGSLQFLL